MAESDKSWMRTIEVHYSPATYQQAARTFWLSLNQSRIAAAGTAAVLFLIGAILLGATEIGLVVFMVAAWGIALASFYLCREYGRQAADVLQDMVDPVAKFEIGERSYRLRSEFGETDLPWRSVVTLKRMPAVWVMLFSNRDFIALPAEDLDDDTRSVLEARVRAAGGKIA